MKLQNSSSAHIGIAFLCLQKGLGIPSEYSLFWRQLFTTCWTSATDLRSGEISGDMYRCAHTDLVGKDERRMITDGGSPRYVDRRLFNGMNIPNWISRGLVTGFLEADSWVCNVYYRICACRLPLKIEA
jgi:hypothetical protein